MKTASEPQRTRALIVGVDLDQRFEQLARENDRSYSAEARQALAAWVDRAAAELSHPDGTKDKRRR